MLAIFYDFFTPSPLIVDVFYGRPPMANKYMSTMKMRLENFYEKKIYLQKLFHPIVVGRSQIDLDDTSVHKMML